MRQRSQVQDVWPIMPGSERPPHGWPGWPDGKKFAVVLTHDVEGPVGLGKCRQLMRLEQKLGFRSSFGFIPEGSYDTPWDLRDELVRNGFEIAVHDLEHDGRLYRKRAGFLKKAERINHYLKEWGAVGFRSGFMLRNLGWLHDLRIQYDMSTFDTDPFEPQPDGRHTIFPFWVPRVSDDRRQQAGDRRQRTEDSSSHIRASTFELRHSAGGAGGYVEMPYTLPQDSTLFLLLREKTIEIWIRKLDWIANHGGMVLLDTHPDYMAFDGARSNEMEYPVDLYEQLLEYIGSKYRGEYWAALPKDVANHVLGYVQAPASISSVNLVQESTISEPTSFADTDGQSANGNGEERVADGSARNGDRVNLNGQQSLRGKRAAIVLFSHYPSDPRPRRAAEALAMEGVEIDLICLQEKPEQPRRELVNGINVYRSPLKKKRAGKLHYITQYSAFILSSFVYLTLRSLRRRYDFVHVHNMPDVLVFSALVPKVLGAKIILDLHDPMPELMQTIFNLPENSLSVRLLKGAERKSIGFANLVLTVNRACAQIYSSRSCHPQKIKVVLNSPDDAIFRFKQANLRNGNGSHPPKTFRVLYHGSLTSRNGFDLAVDALAAVRGKIPQITMIVCGTRTEFFDQVMNTLRPRGLEQCVQYLGPQDRNQIVAAVEGCELGVIPNRRNIFTEINTPTRIFEYLALGKPVIAPRARGIQDYFGEDDLVYFELGDVADLARKIEYVYANPAEVAETVERGQKIYLAHTWSKERVGLLNSFRDLL